MNTTVIDFSRIGTAKDLYKTLSHSWQLPDYFGNNLDALWDVVTGYIKLPQTLSFINMSLPQLEKFEAFITLFEEAQEALGEGFVFSYGLNNS
ncbi:MAG: barstar family protein [Chitinophagaceae bacterium]|jgi:ribonuclease inhibitor|nr:barstar family protein [Chitinophagaceae bacterium]